jgi:hypothetical protein
MGSAASRLFHTVVVLGASAGCGGIEAGRPAGHSGAATDAAAAPTPEAGVLSPPHIDATAPPTSPCDCARVGSFRCARCASGAAPVDGRCAANDGVDCICDATVAVADPSDCPSPAQFTCRLAAGSDASVEGYGPFVSDWFAYADCYCDPTRPVLASQCSCPYCDLQCATGSGCALGTVAEATFGGTLDGSSDAVRYACGCLPPVPQIR